MSYFHYDIKSNGTVYASVYESFRDQGKVKTRRIENLGRVVDKANNIFCQKGNTFKYILGKGREDMPIPDQPSAEPDIPLKERMILDFGDSWFMQEYLQRQPFYNSIKNVLPDESDTVISLILYRMLSHKGASCHARIWYEGNYSCIAFPEANLSGQNISRVLQKLGQEEIRRRFFEDYLSSVYGQKGSAGILIDSTGVPNATNMDITQLSNHNGDINREVRLIYAIDQETGMPLFFRYVAGNIIDVTTLITTVHELEQYGVSAKRAILDAGYFSENNAKELFESGIPFMTRLASNKPVFKTAAAGNMKDLMTQEYARRYGERVVFIKKVPTPLCGHTAYVYLCIDEDTYLMQHKKTILNAIDEKRDFDETDAAVRELGAFALLASEDVPEDSLLPMYYTRQQVEQVFDISKNYADLLPIRVQSEEAFAGHLMICFIATIIMQKLQQELLKRRSKKAKQLNTESILAYLRNQKCKVYKECAIPQEPRKEVNAIYDIFKMKSPHKIALISAEKA